MSMSTSTSTSMSLSTEDEYFDKMDDFIAHQPIGSPFSMDRLTPASLHHSSLRKPKRLLAFWPRCAYERDLARLRPASPASSRQNSRYAKPRRVLSYQCAFHST
jgi:hypothetical protein